MAGSSSSRPRRLHGPALAEAAEDWLAVKPVGRRADDPGHADRARRSDLRRWAAALATVLGRTRDEESHGLDAWDLVTMTEPGDGDVVVRALDLLAGELEPG